MSYSYASYCISLRANTQERVRCTQEFDGVGLHVDFHIVDPHPQGGHQGCFTSHQEALQRGLDTAADVIMIFEDDVYFEGFTHTHFLSLLEWVTILPSDQHWCCNLGYFAFEKGHLITPQIMSLDRCYCAHAYFVPRRTAQLLCALPWRKTPFDVQWHEVIDHFYAPYPMVAFQHEHISIVSTLSSLFMMIIGFRNLARLCEWWCSRNF